MGILLLILELSEVSLELLKSGLGLLKGSCLGKLVFVILTAEAEATRAQRAENFIRDCKKSLINEDVFGLISPLFSFLK